MRQLAIFSGDVKAGVLTEHTPGRAYSFVYDKLFLESDLPAISLTLPKRQKPYESESIHPFFTNLLPEGANRKVICRVRRIDENDFFGMLMATVDTDMIGCVNIRNVSHD